ncbi:RNA-binding protein 7 [Belonocnema kinseyi]|uniref:RNA-binding protein 7 n=1 Tax=Belonocnema kinseyi TaxID=2817044 RepID=UPI00143D0BD6|nr:RNA-binding protein 7 [Belonocnema kinseyi]
MDDDARTIWCGNLSEKVTEEILYELFLQGGPLQRVNIPKDRDGKQRSFGFVTYKHVSSVPYALDLFNGTFLYNRAISVKSRSNGEAPQLPPEQNLPLNDLIQLGNQMLIGNCIPNLSMGGMGFGNSYPPQLMHPSQFLGASFPNNYNEYNDDRRPQRSHPYHREHDNRGRHDNRYNNDHGRDNRRDHVSSHRDKHREGSHRSNRNESRRNYRN